MLRISLPSTKRPSYLQGGYKTHTIEMFTRHKSLVVAALIILLSTTALAAAALRHSVANTQPKEANISTSTSSDSAISAQLAVPSDQPAQPPAGQSPAPDQTAPGAQNQASSSTQVKVNGQNVPVPQNGTVHTTVPTAGGSSNVNVTMNSQSTGGGNSSSSSSVQVNTNSTNSQSQVTIQNSQ